MHSIIVLVFYFVAFVISQSLSTTVSVLVPFLGSEAIPGLVGSIAGADASATTYVIGCASSPSNLTVVAPTSMGVNSSVTGPSDPSSECGFAESQTITQGASTYHWAVSPTDADDGVTFDCVLTGSSQAVCVTTASGSAITAAPNATDNFKPISTETFSGTTLPPYKQVLMTAGLSNLKSSNVSSTEPQVSTSSGHMGGTNTATASSGKSTSKSSSGAIGVEPGLAMGAAAILGLGLAAFAL